MFPRADSAEYVYIHIGRNNTRNRFPDNLETCINNYLIKTSFFFIERNKRNHVGPERMNIDTANNRGTILKTLINNDIILSIVGRIDFFIRWYSDA